MTKNINTSTSKIAQDLLEWANRADTFNVRIFLLGANLTEYQLYKLEQEEEKISVALTKLMAKRFNLVMERKLRFDEYAEDYHLYSRWHREELLKKNITPEEFMAQFRNAADDCEFEYA